jgi:hypothetical protein
LTLLDEGPSVLIQPSILDDEDEGEDGKWTCCLCCIEHVHLSNIGENFSTSISSDFLWSV